MGEVPSATELDNLIRKLKANEDLIIPLDLFTAFLKDILTKMFKDMKIKHENTIKLKASDNTFGTFKNQIDELVKSKIIKISAGIKLENKFYVQYQQLMNKLDIKVADIIKLQNLSKKVKTLDTLAEDKLIT